MAGHWEHLLADGGSRVIGPAFMDSVFGGMMVNLSVEGCLEAVIYVRAQSGNEKSSVRLYGWAEAE